jgi:RNA polymerase sigma-70 factor, ECF subfamily
VAKPRTAGTALEEAFRTDRDDLRAYARRRLGDHALADETVQETFLRAWRSIHRLDLDAGTPRMWLFGICRNAVADVLRRRAREVSSSTLTDAVDVAERPQSAAAERNVIGDRAADALAAMTPPQRDAVIQVLLFERPYVQAAAALGVPVGTVKSRVHSGLSSARRAAA